MMMALAEVGTADAAIVISNGLTGSLKQPLTRLTGRASVRSDSLIDALPIVGASTKFVGRPQQATSKVIKADSRSRRRCSQRCVPRYMGR